MTEKAEPAYTAVRHTDFEGSYWAVNYDDERIGTAWSWIGCGYIIWRHKKIRRWLR